MKISVAVLQPANKVVLTSSLTFLIINLYALYVMRIRSGSVQGIVDLVACVKKDLLDGTSAEDPVSNTKIVLYKMYKSIALCTVYDV